MSQQQTDRTDPLGRRIASYASRPRPRTLRVLPFGCAITLAIAAVWLGWHPIENRWLVGWLAAFSVASLGMGWHFRTAGQIDLYQRGLIWLRGRRRYVLYWNEIREIYRIRGGAPRREGRQRRWVCRLVRQNGRTWQLCRFEGLASLSARIQSELTRCQLRSALETFRAGYPVRFGAQLTLSRQGLQVGSKYLPWHAVREVALDEGRGIRIRSSADRSLVLQLTASEVPNLGLLGSLLEEIRKQMAPPRSSEEHPLKEESDSLISSRGDLGPDGDPSDLLLAGYDWEDIRSVLRGECSLDELKSRGPYHRPRRPR